MKAVPARVAFGAALGLLAAASLPGRALGADRVDVCASAAEESQSLRAQGHLTAARKKLVVCADPTCPGVVKKHCGTWLAEVDKATPSLVVRARDVRNQDVSGAKVFVDGTEIAGSITGLAAPIDPGPHTVRVVAASGAIAEQSVIIAEGEKDRPVVLTFQVRLSPDGSSDGAPRAAGPVAPPPPESSPSRITSPFLITAGVGVVALGLFTGLEIAGHADYSKLKDACGADGSHCPNDAPETISSGRSKFVGAGVALGVAGAAIGIATIILIVGPKSRTSASEATKALLIPGRGAPPSLGTVRF